MAGCNGTTDVNEICRRRRRHQPKYQKMKSESEMKVILSKCEIVDKRHQHTNGSLDDDAIRFDVATLPIHTHYTYFVFAKSFRQ